MDRRAVATTLAGFLVAAATFAVMFTLVDTDGVVAAIERANLWLVALVGVTTIGWVCFWGLALWNVLGALDVDVPVRDALLVTAAGIFVNHVTPFGQAGGEPITAALLARRTDADYDVSLASITSFDAVNVVPSLTFAALGIAYFAATSAVGSQLGLYLGIAAIVILGAPIAGVAIWRKRAWIERGIVRFLTRAIEVGAPVLPWVSRDDADGVAAGIAGYVESLEVVASDRRRVLAAVACSGAGWAVQAIGLWIAFRAIGVHVPLYVPFFVVPIGTMASVLPTPGGLGGIEAVTVTLMTLVTGVAGADAAVAVTLHSVGGYLLSGTVGAGAAVVLGLRPRSFAGGGAGGGGIGAAEEDGIGGAGGSVGDAGGGPGDAGGVNDTGDGDEGAGDDAGPK